MRRRISGLITPFNSRLIPSPNPIRRASLKAEFTLAKHESSNKKITIIGAGDIGKHTLATILRIFPKDKDVDVVLLNRNEDKAKSVLMDAELAGDDNFGVDQPKNKESKIKVKTSSSSSELQNSDIVIFTAGVSAINIGSSNREAALPFIYDVINNYGAQIKLYAPESTVLVITNPSDIATWLMYDATGFLSEKVLGFGCELDARRFAKALRKELEKIDITPKTINAEVIGGHSAENMIVPKRSIKIDGMSLLEFKAQYPNQTKEINEAIKNAEATMRTEGFDVIKKGGKSYIIPVISVAIAARAFLFGEVASMSCSQVLTAERSYCDINNSCISVPVIIKNKSLEMNPQTSLDNEEIVELRRVAKSHQELFNDIKNIPPDIIMRFKSLLTEMQKNVSAQRAATGALEQAVKNVTDRRDSSWSFISRFLEITPSDEKQHSELRMVIKDKFSGVIPPESELDALEQAASRLRENGVDVNVRGERFYLEKTQENMKTLETLGIVDANQHQKR